MTQIVIAFTIAWLFVMGEARAKLPAKELPIELVVRPINCFEPCYVRVEVVVPPRYENRWAVIEVDGPMFRSSSFQLDGDRAAKRHTLEVGGLLAGEYEVKGILFDTSKEVSRQHQRLTVIGQQE